MLGGNSVFPFLNPNFGIQSLFNLNQKKKVHAGERGKRILRKNNRKNTPGRLTEYGVTLNPSTLEIKRFTVKHLFRAKQFHVATQPPQTDRKHKVVGNIYITRNGKRLQMGY